MNTLKDLTCKYCGKKFKTPNERNKHLIDVHNVTYEEYIVHFLFNDEYPTCKCGCGTQLKFSAHTPKYFKEYTTNHFPRKPHTVATKKKIAVGCEKTMMEKYGVSNPSLLKTVLAKIKQTKLDKYGDECYNNMKKNKQTKLERYGDENYHNIEKTKQTYQDRYGVDFYLSTTECKEKGKQTKLERYGDENYNNAEKNKQTNLKNCGYTTNLLDPEFRKKYNWKYSKIEETVCNLVGGEHKFIYENKEYDFIKDSDIVEIDGDYWHPGTLNDLNFSQLANLRNDKEKIDIINNQSQYKLYKIHVSDLPQDLSILDMNYIKEHSYIPDYTISYDMPIFTKSYLQKFDSEKDKIKLKSKVKFAVKFLRTFQHEFPYPPITETPSEIITKIQTCNKSNIITTENNIPTFNNNAAFSAGVTYLKSTCKSYWKSSFKNSVSPVEAWYDDDVMEKIIAYRIGLNNSGEVFDLSLHQIIKGLSASRYSISFFKPVLAFSIYKYILGGVDNPTVFDPCCGFGGRLIGFKAAYPNGTYIGCEPNTQTYNELLELVSQFNFNDVKLFNCKLEDLNENIKYDIGFTSIPYFNKETYSKQVNYNSIDDWKNTFVNTLNKYHDMYINLPIGLIENNNVIGYVGNSTSHWNSKKDKKKELIIKID